MIAARVLKGANPVPGGSSWPWWGMGIIFSKSASESFVSFRARCGEAHQCRSCHGTRGQRHVLPWFHFARIRGSRCQRAHHTHRCNLLATPSAMRTTLLCAAVVKGEHGVGRMRSLRDLSALSDPDLVRMALERNDAAFRALGAPPLNARCDALSNGQSTIYRRCSVVFVMRDIEDMSACLSGLHPATVKTRLHRARRLLRNVLDDKLAAALTEAFPFGGIRCGRMTDAILQRLGLAPTR